MIFIYYLLSLISGFALTLQVGINGVLRSKIGSPILSSLISFGVGTLGLALVFFFTVSNGSSPLPTATHIKIQVGGCF